MKNCPDCGVENPSDLHTCIEYERNENRRLRQQYDYLYDEIVKLREKIIELEHQAAGRAPWRS